MTERAYPALVGWGQSQAVASEDMAQKKSCSCELWWDSSVLS